MPIMFRTCRQSAGNTLPEPNPILPRSLWPHIQYGSSITVEYITPLTSRFHRTFILLCECADLDQIYDPKKAAQLRASGVDTDTVCRAFDSDDLIIALRNMPRISTLEIRPRYSHEHAHGLSWHTFISLLSAPPGVQNVNLLKLHICPKDMGAIPSFSPCLSQLQSFDYKMRDVRHPWSIPSEERALSVLVHSLHATVEALLLTTEPSPIQSIALLDWPRLRTLKLRGERWTSPTTPIVRLFAHMSNLRCLSLELSEPAGVDMRAIWPPELCDVVLPWPFLEHLSVSHPHRHDQIYAHLPRTLRSLSLRPSPHGCIRTWNDEIVARDTRARFPVSDASELWEIIRHCSCSFLQTLEVEYCASGDGDESRLLGEVAKQFPGLRTLNIYRHQHTQNDMSAVSIHHGRMTISAHS